MNEIYCLIWNETQQIWKTVTKKGRGRGGITARAIGLVAIIAAFLAVNDHAWALDPTELPSGGQIVAGQGSIGTNGSAMTVIQGSERMVSDWSTFNIGRDASVSFQQPGASSVALNRIQDTSPSQIYGRLSANGHVFLLNPSGILFGPTTQVNVGGLVASSLSMTNEDFMAGRYDFQTSGNAGAIINQGQIRTADGGYVAFLSPQVKNEGEIVASQGMVAMAAGEKVRLDFTGDHLVSFVVDQGAVDALVENSGAIQADGGAVILTARAADSLTQSVVNNEGVIEAKGLYEQNGRILLDADGGQTTAAGTLDVSSPDSTGGRIMATGDRVLVASNAHLNASGATGGGEIFVGGSWQGEDPAIRQATGTVVEQGALLEANATDAGDGGTVVAWSDVTDVNSVTRAYGTFQAMGGPNGGDGGRIETSGHWLDTAGSTGSAGALHGTAGEWLFDPYNVTIAGAASGGGSFSDGTPSIWTPSASGSTILNTDLNTKLLTTDVTITTTGGGAEDGNITVTSPITMNDRTLRLLADGTVTISANITGNRSSQLFLESGTNGATNKAITINNYINLAGGGQLTLTSTGGATANAEIDAYGLLALYGSGAFNLNSHSGTSDIDYFTANLTGAGSSINLYENFDFFHITAAGVTCPGDVTLRAVRNFDVDGPIELTGSGDLVLTVGTGSYIRVSAPITLNSGSLSFTTESGSSTYTISQAIAASGAGLTFDQPVTLSGTSPSISCNGTLTFSDTLTLASSSNTVLSANNYSFSGNVTGDGTQQLTLRPYASGGSLTIGSGGNVDTAASLFSGLSSLTFGRSDGTGTTEVIGNTSVSASDHLELVNQTVNVTGGTLTNTGGDIMLTGDTFDITKGITANGGNGKVTLRQQTTANALTLGSGITGAMLDQISAGTLEIGRINGGNVSFDGDITTTVNAMNVFSGGDITLGSGVTLDVGTGTAGLVATGHFINNSGSSAISTSGGGRWLIYTAGPTGDTFGGLASSNLALWNKTYAGYPPTSVTETGNRYLFSTQPSLAFTASDRAKTYGQILDLSSPSEGTDYTVTGLVNAATYGNVFSQDSYTGSPTMSSTGSASGSTVASSPYAITIAAGTLTTPTGYGSSSYTNGSLTVNKANLTAVYTGTNKVYDATTSATVTGSSTDIIDGDTVTFTESAVFSDKNVGSGKTINVSSIALGGADSGNYSLQNTTATATADITKATLTTTGAAAQDKVYDATTAATITGETLVGVLLSDVVTVSGDGTFADKAVGTSKSVTAALTIAGADSGNYQLTQPTGLAADITKANLAVTGLTASNKVYDATLTATLGGTAAITKLGTDDVTIGGTASGAFADKNVGTGKAITVTGNTISGDDAGNYTLVQQTGLTADITAKGISATGITAADKNYDGTTDATLNTGSAGLSGVIAGDTTTLDTSSAAGAFVNPNVGRDKTVNVTSLALSGLDAGNYTLAAYSTTANINAYVPGDQLSPQHSINGTQLDQENEGGTSTPSSMGPGGGSTTLTSFATSTLVGNNFQTGGPTVLSSTIFTAPVTFTRTGSTSTMTLEDGGTPSSTMLEVGTLPVFTQSDGGPVGYGSFVVQESQTSLSLTKTAFSGVPPEIGSPIGEAVPFMLFMPNGMTVEMTSSVTDKGFLIINVPDSSDMTDLSQATLMGMMVMKNGQNVDIGTLKGILVINAY